MCDMCNPKMYDREVYYNSEDDSWYFDIETGEWSDYNDDFIHIQRQINYCPYCGRRLRCKNEKNEIHTETYDDGTFVPNPSNCHLSYINYNAWTGDEMIMCRQNYKHCPVVNGSKCPYIPTDDLDCIIDAFNAIPEIYPIRTQEVEDIIIRNPNRKD